MAHREKTSQLVKYVHKHPQIFVVVAVLALVAGALTLSANHREYRLQANTSDAAWYSPKTSNSSSNWLWRALTMGSKSSVSAPSPGTSVSVTSGMQPGAEPLSGNPEPGGGSGGGSLGGSGGQGGSGGSTVTGGGFTGGLPPVTANGQVRLFVRVNLYDNGVITPLGGASVNAPALSEKSHCFTSGGSCEVRGMLPVPADSNSSTFINISATTFHPTAGQLSGNTSVSVQPMISHATNYYPTITLRVPPKTWTGTVYVQTINDETGKYQPGTSVKILSQGIFAQTQGNGKATLTNVTFTERQGIRIDANYDDWWFSGQQVEGSGSFTPQFGKDSYTIVIHMHGNGDSEEQF